MENDNLKTESNNANVLLCDGWFKSDSPPNDSRSILIWTEQGMAEGSYSSGKFLQFRWSCYPNVICWRELPKPPFA
jgi:hypothetical protein